MVFNSIGQLLPNINSKTCIECGLCYDSCPSLDLKRTNQELFHNGVNLYGNIIGSYIGRALDDIIYQNSQSGGVTTAILTYLFDNKCIEAAVVCCVEYSEEYLSNAIIVTNKQDLLRCQKSSYSPVDMVSALKKTGSYDSVAFVGTGCHIQGVRTLQSMGKGKKYANIKYLIGLICDRTLCKTATDVLYGHYGNDKKKKIIWRDKSENYKKAKLLIKEENGREIEISSWKRHYLKQYFTAPRCLICYDKLNLNADIVLGDPWGVLDVDWIRGESLVLCRTSIGQTIINQMIQSNLVSLRQVEPYFALKGQAMETRLSNIRKNMLLYREKGWILPKYSNLILSDAIEKPTNCNRKIIDEFNKDSQKTKKTIVRKYRRRISIMSFKNNIYKIFSLIKLR